MAGKTQVGGNKIVLVLFLLVLATAICAEARDIVDMNGRRVSVPARIDKVYCASPPSLNLLYAIDPSLIAGWNFPLKDEDKLFMNRKALALPVIGGWFGQGHSANLETLLKVSPDVILMSQWKVGDTSASAEMVLNRLHKPMVYVKVFDLADYPSTCLFLGRLLGRNKRAEELAKYANKALQEVKKVTGLIPERQKVAVYYAEGTDGLSTECGRSFHAELINLAGGRNVHLCSLKDSPDHDMEKVTMEQVLLYNPEVMIVRERVFFRKVFSDARWKNIRAVRNGRVYLTPKAPFSWFDRPPSFMRLLGLKWLTSLLYPERYRIDMVKETKYFYRLFLQVDLSDDQIRKIMNL